MTYEDRPEVLEKLDRYNTIPDASVALNAEDELSDTDVGDVNLTGRFIWLHATVALRVIRGGSGAVGAGVGLPLAAGERIRFFVDPTKSTVIRHSGTDGQLVALYDTGA
ncbi:MAG: hypothetical protein H6721_26695 [Sandaracinus sp.]|nr:hypothetical protein [Sandaracinus sp.]MCB9620439.1 hypothetical protein [Sandaracinus sp.]MCB9635723.1 hypothetical protein [Sandaracinus sp.]